MEQCLQAEIILEHCMNKARTDGYVNPDKQHFKMVLGNYVKNKKKRDDKAAKQGASTSA